MGELSGGQQRRVLLARALVKDPPVLLLDEPAAGLDLPSDEALTALLRDLADQGKTLIVATHDISCVHDHYDQALLINRRVVAYGPASTVISEATLEQTFGRHLVSWRVDGRGYAAEPHSSHEARAS